MKPKNAPLIQATNLHKVYHHRRPAKNRSSRLAFWRRETVTTHALSDVSFSIERGERVALIGPNGAGKSTTIKVLTGLLEPSSGTASVGGLTPWLERRTLAHSIGCVFGNLAQLWPNISVRENFILIGGMYGVPYTELTRRIASLSERFGVAELIDKRPTTLSLGERMKSEILGSLLHQPKILLLDEPSIGLDIVARLTLRQTLRELCAEAGTTVLLTSHDTGDIEGVCERVIVINEGTAIFDGSLGELRRTAMNRKQIEVLSSVEEFVMTDPRLTVANDGENRHIVTFDPTQIPIDQAVALVLATGSVIDITIGDPPLEEVIAKAFMEGVCSVP